MLTRLLYLILLTLVARLVFRAVAELFGSGSSSSSSSSSGRVGDPGKRVLSKGRMVRDPVCGLNLPEDRALVAVIDGESFYFCSARCRDDFSAERGRKRASA